MNYGNLFLWKPKKKLKKTFYSTSKYCKRPLGLVGVISYNTMDKLGSNYQEFLYSNVLSKNGKNGEKKIKLEFTIQNSIILLLECVRIFLPTTIV